MLKKAASCVLVARGARRIFTIRLALLAACGLAGPDSAEAASRRRADLFEHPVHLLKWVEFSTNHLDSRLW